MVGPPPVGGSRVAVRCGNPVEPLLCFCAAPCLPAFLDGLAMLLVPKARKGFSSSRSFMPPDGTTVRTVVCRRRRERGVIGTAGVLGVHWCPPSSGGKFGACVSGRRHSLRCSCPGRGRRLFDCATIRSLSTRRNRTRTVPGRSSSQKSVGGIFEFVAGRVVRSLHTFPLPAPPDMAVSISRSKAVLDPILAMVRILLAEEICRVSERHGRSSRCT